MKIKFYYYAVAKETSDPNSKVLGIVAINEYDEMEISTISRYQLRLMEDGFYTVDFAEDTPVYKRLMRIALKRAQANIAEETNEPHTVVEVRELDYKEAIEFKGNREIEGFLRWLLTDWHKENEEANVPLHKRIYSRRIDHYASELSGTYKGNLYAKIDELAAEVMGLQ